MLKSKKILFTVKILNKNKIKKCYQKKKKKKIMKNKRILLIKKYKNNLFYAEKIHLTV